MKFNNYNIMLLFAFCHRKALQLYGTKYDLLTQIVFECMQWKNEKFNLKFKDRDDLDLTDFSIDWLSFQGLMDSIWNLKEP